MLLGLFLLGNSFHTLGRRNSISDMNQPQVAVMPYEQQVNGYSYIQLCLSIMSERSDYTGGEAVRVQVVERRQSKKVVNLFWLHSPMIDLIAVLLQF